MTTKAKTVSLVAVFTVATVLLSAVPNWFAPRAENQGSTLWGAWHLALDVSALLGPGATVPALGTFHRDGTFTAGDGTDFGGFPFPSKNAMQQGVWVRTGGGAFEARSLFLSFDAITNELNAISGLRLNFHFDADFDHFRGEAIQSVWLCPTSFTCPDPLTTAPDIPVAGVFPFTGTRLRVE